MEGQCGCASEVVLPAKRSPWGRAPGVGPQPSSLAAVMDEELARELQSKEGGVDAVVEAFGSVSEAFSCEEAHNAPDEDLLLAQMLQLEFDRENDLHLMAQERHVNGDSKGVCVDGPRHMSWAVSRVSVRAFSGCLAPLAVSISYSKYRAVHPALAEDEANPHPYDLIEDVMEGVSQFSAAVCKWTSTGDFEIFPTQLREVMGGRVHLEMAGASCEPGHRSLSQGHLDKLTTSLEPGPKRSLSLKSSSLHMQL